MNTNHAHGTPDDVFLARVRESVHAAVPESTLDLEDVLRSSRRKHATRRAGVTLASALALATAGAGAAGALPGVPGLWNSAPVEVAPIDTPSPYGEVDVSPAPPSPTAIPVLEQEAELVDLAPGVTAVARPAAYRVDSDTTVLDLGLDAGGGNRYLAVVTLAKIDGRHSATDLEVLAGSDTALENLRAGDLGGTLLWRGVTSDAMVLPSDGGPALVLGFSSGATEGNQFLVFDDPQTGGAASAQGAFAAPDAGNGPGGGAPDKAAGAPAAGSSLPVTPFDVLGDGSVWMRVLQVDRTATEPRGFVYSNQGTWSASWCRSTSPECAVIHDVAGRAVERPKAVEPAPMVARLAPLLARDVQANEVPAMEACVAQRTGTSWTASPQLTGKTFWRAPNGVDADVWRLCLIDLSEALQLASTGAVRPDVSTRPAPSEEPTEAPEDEDLLGLGALLEEIFGG